MGTRKILGALLLLGSTALAQPADEPPALSGPKVRAPERQPQAFMPSEQQLRQRKAAEGRALPRILRQMSGPRADASIRLRAEQLRAMRSIREQFDADVRAYLARHQDNLLDDLRVLGADGVADKLKRGSDLPAGELTELLAQVPRQVLAKAADGQNARDLDRRALYRSLSEPKREALQRMGEIQRAAPSTDSIQESVLKQLDQSQRSYVEQQFTRIHEALATASRQRQQAQEMRQNGNQPGEMMAPNENKDPAPRGPDRLEKLIAELLPAEREMLADFIERRLLEGRNRPGRAKPAPKIDELSLPENDPDKR